LRQTKHERKNPTFSRLFLNSRQIRSREPETKTETKAAGDQIKQKEQRQVSMLAFFWLQNALEEEEGRR